MARFSSRERMLAVLECREADYVPCCFSALQSLQQQCTDQADFLDQQLGMEMGMDAAVTVPTIPIRHGRGYASIYEIRDIHHGYNLLRRCS